jgi:hypothetical protein
MSKEQEEDFLHDVFGLTHGNTAGAHITKQGIAKPVEQDEHVQLESCLLENPSRPVRRERRQAQCGLWCGAADHEVMTRRTAFYISG